MYWFLRLILTLFYPALLEFNSFLDLNISVSTTTFRIRREALSWTILVGTGEGSFQPDDQAGIRTESATDFRPDMS